MSNAVREREESPALGSIGVTETYPIRLRTSAEDFEYKKALGQDRDAAASNLDDDDEATKTKMVSRPDHTVVIIIGPMS